MINYSVEKTKENIDFITFNIHDKLEITFANIGASIFEIKFSDCAGNLENIVLTPNSRQYWIENRTFSGSIIGPLAGRYEISDTSLEVNRPPYHFHGGNAGYDKKIWDFEINELPYETQLIFTLNDFENHLKVKVIYSINQHLQLKMAISAIATKKTHFNPTNHIYFNLSGNNQDTVESHTLYLSSNQYFVENTEKVIIGSSKITKDDILDFSDLDGKSLKNLSTFDGLDTTFSLDKKKVGIISHPQSGRAVKINTTLPAAVVFTLNQPQIHFENKPKYSGITFETQYPANNLEKVMLKAGEEYFSETTYSFLNLKDKKMDGNSCNLI